MAEAFGIACHELVSLDFRCGSKAEVQRGPRNVRFWGKSRPQIRATGCLLLPSRPGEFHPEPLTEPDVILSHHLAHAIARRLPPSAEQEGSSRHNRLAQVQRR